MSALPEKVHATFSPSAAERWIACPGSVKLSENCPKTTSKYAEEGTLAHALAEQCLLTPDKNADDFVGKRIDGQLITQEMAEFVQVYVEHCRSIAMFCDSVAIEE